MKGFKKKYWTIPVMVFIVLLVVFRSGAFSNDGAKLEEANSLINIKVAEAQLVATVPNLLLSGSIEGKTSAIVSAKLGGRIEQVMVQEGQQVHIGDPLVRLESVELANSVDSSQDAVTKAQINYDLAKTDYQRYQTLFTQGATSQQTLDTAEAKQRLAEADLSSALTSKNNAKQQLAYGVITAPVDGVVANVTATVGQVVSPGAALMAVQDISQVYAVVNIEQKDLDLIKIGQKAEVTVDTYGTKIFAGRVEMINPEAGTTNRMFRTKVKVDNGDGALKAGMYMKVQLATGVAVPILTVPQGAVIQKQGIYYVYVMDNDKVTRRKVEIGTATGELIQIKGGLEPGVRLAISNVSQLKDGEVVKIVD
jgi:membrane fusion protein (multidrug efflux system)